jgi:acyl-CoA reductase-like NAD-dependent aldehyde dehydrogenase
MINRLDYSQRPSLLPLGVINIVTGSLDHSSEIGKALCDSELVGALSFTGSTRVGKILNQQCASTIKKVTDVLVNF